MSHHDIKSHKVVRCGIVVTRADGRVEDYGTVARPHKNPILNAVFRVAYRSKTRVLQAYYWIKGALT